MATTVADNSRRDRRIDFARGVALLIIFSDHVEHNLLAQFTPFSVCFFDMSEVFIFLSGFVGGVAYNRELIARGVGACQWKALRRTLQIYLAHVLTLFIHLALLWMLASRVGNRDATTFGSLAEFERQPLSFSLGILTLRQRVAYFDILPVYLALLPFLPLMLALRALASWLMPLLSITLYAATLVFRLDDLFMPHWAWSFQPLAWQVLFFGGAFLATSPRARSACFTNHAGALAVAAVVFLSLVMARLFAPALIPLTNRQLLAPIRLVHFFSMAIVFRHIVFAEFHPEQQRWSASIVMCGRNSLATYCAGAILANLLMLLPGRQAGVVWWTISVNCAGWSGCVAVAYLATYVRAVTRRRGLLIRAASRAASPTSS